MPIIDILLKLTVIFVVSKPMFSATFYSSLTDTDTEILGAEQVNLQNSDYVHSIKVQTKQLNVYYVCHFCQAQAKSVLTIGRLTCVHIDSVGLVQCRSLPLQRFLSIESL